jgi:hypothetical protein
MAYRSGLLFLLPVVVESIHSRHGSATRLGGRQVQVEIRAIQGHGFSGARPLTGRDPFPCFACFSVCDLTANRKGRLIIMPWIRSDSFVFYCK